MADYNKLTASFRQALKAVPEKKNEYPGSRNMAVMMWEGGEGRGPGPKAS